MVKLTSGTENWYIYDNKRDSFNYLYDALRPNLNNAEVSDWSAGFDFLSNGFKCRTNDTAINPSGGTFIYMAFAEAPFVNSNGVPCNAR